MKSLTQQVLESVRQMDRQMGEDDTLKKYITASALFEELVRQGKAQRRGNNLLSPSDQYAVPPVRINS